MPADLFCAEEYTPADKLKAVERELSYRRHVFPRRVADGRMKQADADHQLAVFEAIRDDYKAQLVAVAYLLDVDGTGSLHACASGDPGAFPVYAR